jgi:hypothetical protein
MKTKNWKKKIFLIKMAPLKKGSNTLAPIASPVRFARVQWKSFCAEPRHKRFERIAGKAPKNNSKLKKNNIKYNCRCWSLK